MESHHRKPFIFSEPSTFIFDRHRFSTQDWIDSCLDRGYNHLMQRKCVHRESRMAKQSPTVANSFIKKYTQPLTRSSIWVAIVLDSSLTKSITITAWVSTKPTLIINTHFTITLILFALAMYRNINKDSSLCAFFLCGGESKDFPTREKSLKRQEIHLPASS